MKQITHALLAFAVLFVVAAVPGQTVSADPVDVFKNACSKSSDDAVICKGGSSGLFGVIETVIQVMLVIGGIIAVIMIVLGGIRYITSNGDQADVKAAKDTILYAVIGLIVSAAAFAIVTWVVGKL